MNEQSIDSIDKEIARLFALKERLLDQRFTYRLYIVRKFGPGTYSSVPVREAITEVICGDRFHDKCKGYPKVPKERLFLHTDYLGSFGLEFRCYTASKEDALQKAEEAFKRAEEREGITKYSGYLYR